MNVRHSSLPKLLFRVVGLILLVELITSALPSYWPAILSKDFEKAGWHALINPSSNLFLWWRPDPLLESLDSWFSAQLSYPGLYATSIVLHLGIIFVWLSFGAPVRWVLLSTLSILSLRLVFGWDLIVWRSLVWIPWLVLALRNALLGRDSFLSGLFVLFLGWRIGQSSLPLGFALFCLSLAVSWLPDRLNRPANTAFTKIVICTGLLLSSAPLWSMPSINGQAYPEDAHVVPTQNLAAPLHALLGPSPTIPSFDGLFLKSQLGGYSVLLLALSLLACIRARKNNQLSPVHLFSLCLAVLLSLHLWLPPNLAAIAPLASLARIIPGLFLVDVALLGCAFLIVCVPFCLGWSIFALLVPLGTLLIANHESTLSGKLVQPSRHHPLHELQELSPEQAEIIEPFVFSPSYRLLSEQGLWLALESQNLSKVEFRGVSDATLFASDEKPHSPRSSVFDGDPATRWSPGKGLQLGNEWLLLHLADTRSIRGIEMHTHNFFTDYPRGLRVSTFESCPNSKDETLEKLNQKIVLYEIRNWQGGMGISRLGYPYYEPAHRGRVFFPKGVNTHCILLEQIGEDRQYDWSIAEIKIGYEAAAFK
jgi:hypothetical protein